IETGALAQRIAGLTVTEAQALIATTAALTEPAAITIESPWDSTRLPLLPLRITVRVEVQ
ncbi:MAG TPA: hypothetical protein PKX07_14895, partial [Aggregatilineales bacterium]|nr:hypothetical protein [Aggregatilineales bacterium]